MGPSSFCFCGSALQSCFKTAAAAAPIPTQLGEIFFEVVPYFQEMFILTVFNVDLMKRSCDGVMKAVLD